MWVGFAFAKATHVFFSINTCELDIILTRTINILTTNGLVKLTMLWTTGPRYLLILLTTALFSATNKIVVLFTFVLCSGFRSPLSPLLCFITVVLNTCISLWCFTDEVEDPYVDRTYICNLELYQN